MAIGHESLDAFGSIRTAGLIVAVFVLVCAYPWFACAGHHLSAQPGPDPVLTDGGVHVRAEEPYSRWLIATAQENSATIRRLVQAINASDLLAYVEIGRLAPKLGGTVAFMGASGRALRPGHARRAG
jgi:hypothetical protein